jgi:hypothetical protein
MTALCRIEEAAEELGVPRASLKTAAQKHGFIVRMGRAIRLERDRLPELLKKCRDQPREQGSTSSNIVPIGTSGTPGNQTVQRVAQAAMKLKKRSEHILPQKGEQEPPKNRKM